MHKKKMLAICFSAILLLQTIAGCGYYANPEDNDREEEAEGFLNEAVYNVTYEKPKSTPNVLIDRSGYETHEAKIALFRGNDIQKNFDVIDADTLEVVYTGELDEAVYNEQGNEYISQGDFSEVTAPGTYYIQIPVIGQSYHFEIKEGVYEEIYKNIGASFYYHRCGVNIESNVEVNNHKACHLQNTYRKDTKDFVDTAGGWHTNDDFEKDVAQGCKILSDLLLTWEFLAIEETQEKETTEMKSNLSSLLNETKYEIDWLMKMQEETGGVYTGVYPDGKLTDNIPEKDKRTFYVADVSLEATAEFGAVMSQVARVFNEQDVALAEACLLAARKAYQYLENTGDISDYAYYAAAELYKTTGEGRYAEVVRTFYDTEDQAFFQSAFDRKLYGDLAYLTTTFNVDIEICTHMMDALMTKSKHLATEAKADAYGVFAEQGVRNADVILNNTFMLTIIHHVVASREYISIIKNQIHYLFGRNEHGANMVTGKGVLYSTQGEEDYRLYLQAPLIFIIYEIVEREEVS